MWALQNMSTGVARRVDEHVDGLKRYITNVPASKLPVELADPIGKSNVPSGCWEAWIGLNPLGREHCLYQLPEATPDACSLVLAVSALASCTLPRVRACLISVTVW